VNPPHAVIHSALGALGLATRRWSGLSRAYMWVMGALFAVMAVVGWATVGTRPGIHNVMGMAVDRNNNILHTIWGIGALLLAAKPMLGQNLAEREYNETINEFNSMV